MMRSPSWSWTARAPAWRLGWPRLWRDRWRWLARRWVFALAGFVTGLLGVAGWHLEALEALWASEAQVLDLQEKLREQPAQTNKVSGTSAALSAPTGPPPVMAWWPAPGSQAAVWPQVERLLVQHGLRLLSMRLDPPSTVGVWPSQTVALRLQGRFEAWVAAWAALNARGPVWTMERLRITPQEGGVAVDAVLRLWLSPGPTDKPTPAQAHVSPEPMWGAVPVAPRVGAGAPVFVPTFAPAVVAGLKSEVPVPAALVARSSPVSSESRPKTPHAALRSSDPADWPSDQVRLVGVWQSAQDAQFILQSGQHWVRARVGQRIGTEGHVVQSMQAEEVHLRAEHGTVWVIGLEKAKP